MLGLQRIPPAVTGDGKSTVEALIRYENESNSLRGNGYEAPLSLIPIDGELRDFIGKQGYSPESVLPD